MDISCRESHWDLAPLFWTNALVFANFALFNSRSSFSKYLCFEKLFNNFSMSSFPGYASFPSADICFCWSSLPFCSVQSVCWEREKIFPSNDISVTPVIALWVPLQSLPAEQEIMLLTHGGFLMKEFLVMLLFHLYFCIRQEEWGASRVAQCDQQVTSPCHEQQPTQPLQQIKIIPSRINHFPA